MLPSNFYVYVHSRLSSGEPFYVGKGCGYRWAKKRTRTAHWRSIVAKDGGFHNSFIARDLDEELAFLLEIEVIDKLRRLGVRLANASDGGEGPSGARLTVETKAKISAANKGRPGWWKGKSPSLETRAKLAAAGMGRSATEETRAKLSAKFKGRPLDDETKRKISESLTGRASPKKGTTGPKHSVETRIKMSEAKKGRRPNNFGKKASDEARKRMTEAHLARWARIRAAQAAI